MELKTNQRPMTKTITREFIISEMFQKILNSKNTLILMEVEITGGEINKAVDINCLSTNGYHEKDLEKLAALGTELIKNNLMEQNKLQKAVGFLQDCKKILGLN